MRVLIVDDSAFMRRAVRTMLEADPAIEVIGIARNGKEGVEMAQRLQPETVAEIVSLLLKLPNQASVPAVHEPTRAPAGSSSVSASQRAA